MAVFLWLPLNQASGQSDDNEPIRSSKYGKNRSFSMLKTNPFVPLWGAIPMTSEYRLTYSTATGQGQYAELGLAYLDKNIIFLQGMLSIHNNPGALNYRGHKIHFNYRWVLDAYEMPSGFYVGPHISYAYYRMEYHHSPTLTDYAFIEHVHAALLIGIQERIYDIFYLDIFTGLGYKHNSWGNNVKHSRQKIINMSGMEFVYNNHLKLKAGLSIGIRLN
ncbi:MAG: hypothetical protein R6U19_07640 [Bacteroidales bacterium]